MKQEIVIHVTKTGKVVYHCEYCGQRIEKFFSPVDGRDYDLVSAIDILDVAKQSPEMKNFVNEHEACLKEPS